MSGDQGNLQKMSFNGPALAQDAPGPRKPHRWQPGESGNIHGPPKAVKEIRDYARTFTREAVDRLVQIMRGMDGRLSIDAAKVILTRGLGKELEPERLYQKKITQDQAKDIADVDLKMLSDDQLDRIHAILKEPLP